MRDRLTTDKRKIFVRECPTFMSVTKDELRKLGFQYYCTFEKMKPIYHQL